MKQEFLEIGQLVQLNPETVENKAFAGCFMVITETHHHWGAMGYIQMTGNQENAGGQAYYRAKWEEMELVGYAEWLIEDE